MKRLCRIIPVSVLLTFCLVASARDGGTEPEFKPTKLKDGTPEEVASVVKKWDRARQSSMISATNRAEASLLAAKDAKNAKIAPLPKRRAVLAKQGHLVFSNTRERDAVIKKHESDRENALSEIVRHSKPPSHPPNLHLPIELGEAGFLTETAKVQQVAGETDSLVKITGDDGSSELVWLAGVSMKGVTDGKFIVGVNTPLIVSGTKKYKTALGGSKTVFILKPFEFEKWIDKK